MNLEIPKGTLTQHQYSFPKQEIVRTKAGMPAALQPSIISLFPAQFDVMKTTSAPHVV